MVAAIGTPATPFTGTSGGYDLTQDPQYQTMLQQIQAWSGGPAAEQSNVTNYQNQVSQFATMYQNLTGQAPSQDVINNFTNQIQTGILASPTGEAGSNYASNQNLDTPYIQNTYGPQIQAYQQQQQAGQLQNSESQVQNLVNQTMQNTAGQLSDPNSQVYQQLAGSMNNMGITPSSGAFQAGAGSTIANAGLNAANAGLTDVGLPQISGIANTANQPYQNILGNEQTGLNTVGTNNTNQYDFTEQSQLGQLLAQMSNPSTAQSILGMASGSAGGAGSLLQGGAQAYKATWICTAMVQCNALLPFEVKKLHDHLYRAFWKRPGKFISYLLFGRFLVYLANKSGTNWFLWKPEFYDDVIAETDPVRAVDLYARTFWKLYANVRMNLDGRKLNELVD